MQGDTTNNPTAVLTEQEPNPHLGASPGIPPRRHPDSSTVLYKLRLANVSLGQLGLMEHRDVAGAAALGKARHDRHLTPDGGCRCDMRDTFLLVAARSDRVVPWFQVESRRDYPVFCIKQPLFCTVLHSKQECYKIDGYKSSAQLIARAEAHP
jgi:hypothetical protein